MGGIHHDEISFHLPMGWRQAYFQNHRHPRHPDQRNQIAVKQFMLETKKNTFSALLRDLCGKTSLEPTVKFPDSLAQRQPNHKPRPAPHVYQRNVAPESCHHSFHLPETDAAATFLAQDLNPPYVTASETFFNPGVKFPDTIFRRFFQLFPAFSPGIA